MAVRLAPRARQCLRERPVLRSHQFQPAAGGIGRLAALPKDTPLAFLCHHGGRSARAAEHFRGLGFRQVFNVEGGIEAWALQADPHVPRY